MWKQDVAIAWALAVFAVGMIAVASVAPHADMEAPVAQVNVRGAATGVAPAVREDLELDLQYIRADRAEPY